MSKDNIIPFGSYRETLVNTATIPMYTKVLVTYMNDDGEYLCISEDKKDYALYNKKQLSYN